MSAHEGFHVDLESLTAFSEELTTQLSGMTQPIGHLHSLTGETIEFGAFSEAKLLWHNHDTAAEKMTTLVGQARDAIDFAEEITKSVHSSYDHFDDEYNQKINAAGGIGGVVDSLTGGLTDGVTGTVDGITDGITSSVNGLTHGITGTVDGLTDGITGTVDGLTNGVTGTVDGLTNGVTGTVDGLTHGLGDLLGGGGSVSPLAPGGSSGVDIIGALSGDQGKLTGGTGA